VAKESIPYFVWRGGRPRWIPGPAVRSLGFRGQDLKDGAGEWLSRPLARAAAEDLNAQARARRAQIEGDTVPVPLPVRRTEHSVEALVTAFLNRPRLRGEIEEGRKGRKRLAASSRRAYHAHGQMLREWMGDADARRITPGMIENFYDQLIESGSLGSANAVMRSWKAIFYFGEKKLRWPDLRNPVVGLDMENPDGRRVTWSRPAIDCFVAFADALGWPSLADALFLALLTTQRRNDVLPLKPGAIEKGSIYRFKQGKTGREATVKAVPMLLARMEAMRARKMKRWGEGPAMDTEIICEATGAPYPSDGDFFGRHFAAMKLIAAGRAARPQPGEDATRQADEDAQKAWDKALGLLSITQEKVDALKIAHVPALTGLWFRDLRDTAITWLAAAGCDRYEISKVSGLSITSVDAILQKHYLVLDDDFAIRAGDKLAAHLGKAG
jgi:hypothetical protein